MINKLKELFSNLENSVNTENWSDFEYKVGDIYSNKISWILEEYALSDEAIDTLIELKELVCPILNELDFEINKENYNLNEQ